MVNSTKLKELTIQGIRSFGLKNEDEQTITFDEPLTLLEGENGSGKTTVIESILYAMTGKIPKNSQFFNEMEPIENASAKVILKCCGPDGKIFTIKRSRLLPNGNKTCSLKITGRPDQILSEKELNTRVESSLKFSKVVMENVLFCHQEDASWPFDSGRALKEKFDSIFSIQRFNKASEKIKKIKDKQATNLRVEEEKLETCKLQKQIASKEYSAYENQKDSISNAVVKYNETVKAIDTKNRELQQLDNLRDYLSKMEYKRSLTKQSIQENDFESFDSYAVLTDEDVNQRVANSAATQINIQQQINQKENEMFVKQNLLAKINNEKPLLHSAHGNLTAFKHRFEESKKERNTNLRLLQGKLQTLPKSSFDQRLFYEIHEENAEEIFRIAERNIKDNDDAINEKQRNLENNWNNVSENYNNINVKLSALKAQKKEKLKTVEVINQELVNLEQKFENYKPNSNLDSGIDTLTQSLSYECSEIASLKLRKKKLENNIQDIDEKFSSIHKLSKLKSQQKFLDAANYLLERKISEKDCLDKLKIEYLEIRGGNVKEKLIEIEKYLQERLNLGGNTAEDLYQEYIRKLEREDCCPLCHRGITQQEGISLGNELKEKKQEVLKKIDQNKEILQNLLKQRDNLRAYDFKIQEYEKQINDVSKMVKIFPEFESQIENKKRQLKQENAALTTSQAFLNAFQERLENWNKNLDAKMKILKGKMETSSDGENNLEVILKKKENLKKEIAAVNETLDSAINENFQKQLELSANDKEMQHYIKQSTELKEKNKGLEKSVKELMKQEIEKQTELEQLEIVKRDLLKIRDAEISPMREYLLSLHDQLDQIQRNRDEIVLHLTSGRQEKLQKVEQDLERIASEENKLMSDISCLNQEIDTLRISLTEEKNIERVKQLRDLNEKLKSLNVQIAQFQADNGDVDAKIKSLIESINQLHDLKGQYGNQRQVQLDGGVSKDYTEIEQNYRSICKIYCDQKVKILLMRELIKDLQIYQDSLDKAIILYHERKMLEINNNIKRIWQDTYKGQDIDYIKFESEFEDKDRSKKREYNYSVKKVVGYKKTKMRGACSSGQKVLASMVIRLALAETFCLDGGILTLDEPTTNLDAQHKINLAGAIQRLSASQQNFQLILVTHDEEFRQYLQDNFRNYYKIEKVNGVSKISRLPV